MAFFVGETVFPQTEKSTNRCSCFDQWSRSSNKINN